MPIQNTGQGSSEIEPNLMDEINMNICGECGEVFANAFEAVDHYWQADEMPDKFEPQLRLPGDYSLKLGTMLREIYVAAKRKDVELIKDMTESAYMTLYLSATEPDYVEEFFQEKMIFKAMKGIDAALKDILNEHKEDGR